MNTMKAKSQAHRAGDRPRDEETFTTPEPTADLEDYVYTRFPNLHRPVAYLANGLIGLRVGAVPFLDAKAIVSGYVGRAVSTDHESQADAPFPLGADLIAGESRLSEEPERIEMIEQRLNPSFGELTTRLRFHASAGAVDVHVLTFLPRQFPSVACQEITVTPETAMPLWLEARMDPRGIPGHCRRRYMLQSGLDSVLWWESRDELSTVGAGFATECTGAEDLNSQQNNWGNENLVCQRIYQVQANAGQSVRLRQYGALVPSALQPEPHAQVFHVLRFAQKIGMPRLRYENQEAWCDLWRSRPVVHGVSSGLQRQIDSAFYYVHSSVSRSTPCGLAPFGLSQTEGYYGGHAFTSDTEYYMFPALVLTDPSAARALMEYRYRLRDAAQGQARTLGYDGLFFPNQSGLFGSNATRLSAGQSIDGGSFKNHFVADAFLHYAHAVGDEDFLREMAWPIVCGVAEWMMTRMTRTKRGYEVRNVQVTHQRGNTHNEPPVNRSFQRVLHAAADLADRLGKKHVQRWREAADRILILTEEEDFRRETAWFTPTYKAFAHARNREEVIEEMAGMTGQCISSIRPSLTALRVGCRDLAAQWWPYEVGLHYEADRFGMWCERTAEFDNATALHDQSCFITFPGNMLKQLLIEFPRLAFSFDEPDTWSEGEVVLPEGWEAIEAERVWVRGEPRRLVAEHGRRARWEQP